MAGSELVVYLVALAFIIISVFRNVKKQQAQEQEQQKKKAEKAREVTPPKPVTKKQEKSQPSKTEEGRRVLLDSFIYHSPLDKRHETSSIDQRSLPIDIDQRSFENYGKDIVSKELRMGTSPLKKQKKVRLPGDGTLRAAMLSKEILSPPVGLR